MGHYSDRLVVVFACIGHATMHILAGLYLTVVIGLGDVWAMPYDELIRLWTLGSLMIGLGAPLAGWLSDRWSRSKIMVVFFLVTGGGAVAAGLVGGPTGMVAALVGLGIGASIYHPVAFAWIVRHSAKRGRTMGIVSIFGSLGIAVSATIAASLTEWFDWRAAFLVPGVVSILAGLALAGAISLRLVVDRDSDRVLEAEPERGDLKRAFIVLTVTMICGGMIFNAMQTALPKWFDEEMIGLTGGGMLGVGGLVTLVYLISAFSAVAGGFLCDRLPLKTVYLGGLALQVPLLVLLSGLAELPLLVAVTVAIFVGSGLLPAENLLLARYTPGRHRGLVFGLKFILAFGVAPIAVELVAYSYRVAGGFSLLPWMFGGIGLVAVLAATTLPRGGGVPVPVAAAAE